MKIIGMTIYGYGGIENLNIPKLHPEFQVFYGENEAGKTTIMSFIRSILFGFPSRAQAEPRFEPKSGGKYGGKITLLTELHGKVTVERVEGKASGEVTVYYEDGSTGGEEDLRTLLQGLDRQLFQNIFSFGLQGLQQVETVSAESIGEYLFSSGITGTFALTELEKKLDKLQGELYKPSGRKPKLNEQLARLNELEAEIRKWEKKQDEYDGLLDRKRHLESELASLKESYTHIKQDKERLQLVKGVKPYLDEKRNREYQLGQLEPIAQFPEDGLARFLEWQGLFTPVEAQLSTLTEQLQTAEAEKQTITVSQEKLQARTAVQKLSETKQWIKAKQEEASQLKKEIKWESDQLESDLEKLGPGVELEAIRNTDISLSVREQLKRLGEESVQLEQQKQLLDEEFTDAKADLTNHEEQIRELESRLLPAEERTRLEERLEKASQIDQLLTKKKAFEESYHRLLQQTGDGEGKAQSPLAVLIFFLIGMAAAALLFLQQSWLPLALVIAVLVIGAFIGLNRKNRTASRELEKERSYLVNSLAELEKLLTEAHASKAEFNQLEARLKADSDTMAELVLTKKQLLLAEKRFDKVLAQFETWEQNMLSLHEAKNALIARAGLPSRESIRELSEALELIADIKTRVRNRETLMGALDEVEHEVAAFHEAISSLCPLYQLAFIPEDSFTLLSEMEDQIEAEKRSLQRVEELQEQIEKLSDTIRANETKATTIRGKIASLYEAANVESEDDFRRNARVWDERQRLTKEIAVLNGQIQTYLASVPEKEVIMKEAELDKEDLNDRFQEKNDEMESLERIENELRTALVAIEHQIQSLEQDGTYAELLHEFQLVKSAFNEDAKKWAMYKTAAELLRKTKDHYRKTLLPQVIDLAQGYFQELTGGRYRAILVPDERESFIVERTDGLRFNPEELSQATTEQLYLALRLALAVVYPAAEKMPLIIDDSFVNFDKGRTERIFQLLKALSGERQILFFTCHEHYLIRFAEEEVYHLRTRAVQIS